MKHEFKPGDLALLVKTTHSENVGKVVELIRSDFRDLIDLRPHADHRVVNSLRTLCWVVRGDLTVFNAFGFRERVQFSACPQSWLMPLRGDEHDDLITTERPAELVSA